MDPDKQATISILNKIEDQVQANVRRSQTSIVRCNAITSDIIASREIGSLHRELDAEDLLASFQSHRRQWSDAMRDEEPGTQIGYYSIIPPQEEDI